MKKVIITIDDETKLAADLIRYFKYKNDCYLIYSIGEFDSKNYKKLYLVKIMEELGFPVSQNIKDENEWKGMQKIVQKVIKNLKKNSKVDFEDLDYKLIDGVRINEPRFFKLDSKLVEVLKSNYLEILSDNKQDEPSKVENSVNYKELYDALKKEKETTSDTLDMLMNELLQYKQKYGEL